MLGWQQWKGPQTIKVGKAGSVQQKWKRKRLTLVRGLIPWVTRRSQSSCYRLLLERWVKVRKIAAWLWWDRDDTIVGYSLKNIAFAATTAYGLAGSQEKALRFFPKLCQHPLSGSRNSATRVRTATIVGQKTTTTAISGIWRSTKVWKPSKGTNYWIWLSFYFPFLNVKWVKWEFEMATPTRFASGSRRYPTLPY